MSSRASRLFMWGLVACLPLTACKKAVEPPVPGALLVVQGNSQVAQANNELPGKVTVRLLDVDGAPIPDFQVGFVVSLGGGAVNPASGPTDENGEFSTKWTLGPIDGAQMLRATAGTLQPVDMTAIALTPSDLIVAQGSNQTAKAGAALPNPIVVRVVGPNNVPMKGITVAFQVLTGGGLISPQSGVTNANGEVQSRWTLGPVAGANTIQVVAGALQAVIVTAVGS